MENGIPVYTVVDPRAGMIVVEGYKRPGGNDFHNPLMMYLAGTDTRPDVWIEANNNMGNGSSTVCDGGAPPPTGGGIPGINPIRFFDPTPAVNLMITHALQDFACRFTIVNNPPQITNPCTRTGTGSPAQVNSLSQMQVCDQVAQIEAFPTGDTVLTLRLQDNAGLLGPTAQIIIRVIPTPTPPPP
jgi:hypothetical protein